MELDENVELAEDKELKGDGETTPEDKVDSLPEYCHYRDEGCELAESCLKCPFERCIDEEPGGRQRWLKTWRDQEMARLSIIDGKPIRELSQIFGVSQRTVQRALKTILGSRKGKKNE